MASGSRTVAQWAMVDDDGRDVLVVNTRRGAAYGARACALVSHSAFAEYVGGGDSADVSMIERDFGRIGVTAAQADVAGALSYGQPHRLEVTLALSDSPAALARCRVLLQAVLDHTTIKQIRVLTDEIRDPRQLGLALQTAELISGLTVPRDRLVEWTPVLSAVQWPLCLARIQSLVEGGVTCFVVLCLHSRESSLRADSELKDCLAACDLIESWGARSQLSLAWDGDEGGLLRIVSAWGERCDTELDIIPLYADANAGNRDGLRVMAEVREAIVLLERVMDMFPDRLDRIALFRRVLQRAMISTSAAHTVVYRFLDPNWGVARSKHHAAARELLSTWPANAYGSVGGGMLRALTEEPPADRSMVVGYPNCPECKYMNICDGYRTDAIDVRMRADLGELATVAAQFECALRMKVLYRFTEGLRSVMAAERASDVILSCKDQRVNITPVGGM